MVTGRPVKIGLTREEVFYCHRGRHQALMKIRTGVTKDGAITAMDFESYLDGGAYGSYGVASLYYTGALQTVTYDVPTYRFRGARAFTNKPPGGPEARARHHAAPLRGRGASRQDRRRAQAGPRRAPAPAPRQAERRDRQLAAARHRRAWRRASTRWWKGRAGRSASGSCPTAAASDWPAPPISPGPGSRSTGTTCRTPARRSSATGAAGSPSSAAPPTSGRAPSRCWPT